MSIYKQENKIIRNLAGEILIKPPVIDISSDYGVSKDGSNLVSYVKDRNLPYRFKSQAGAEPIENGNGFEFTGSENLYSYVNPKYSTEGCTFHFKFSIDSIVTSRLFFKWYWGVGHREWYCSTSSANGGRFFFYWIADGGTTVELLSNLLSLGDNDIMVVIQSDESNTYLASYINGIFAYKDTYAKFEIVNTDRPYSFGQSIEPSNDGNGVMNMYSFKLYDYAMFNIKDL